MSIAPKIGYAQLIRTEMVTISVTTESPVHLCDRCGVTAPRAASTHKVETDRDWGNGRITLAPLPEGWLSFATGGPRDALGNSEHLGSVELCSTCYPIVRETWLVFFLSSGLQAGEKIRQLVWKDAQEAEAARLKEEEARHLKQRQDEARSERTE